MKKPRPPLRNDSTLAEALSEYTKALERRAETSELHTLKRSVHELSTIFASLATLTAKPLPPVKRLELNSGLREATAIALLSDAHVEEYVRPGETPYPNEYNPEIADKSLARFFAALEWKLKLYRQAFKIRHVVLWLGGDLMTGHIHAENVENTATPPIKTLLWLRPRLVCGS